MRQDLQVRQVWPAPNGRGPLSPFEASEDFTQDCWQSSEVIAASKHDRFYSFFRAGTEVVRVLIVDPAEHIDDYDIPDDPAQAIGIDFIEVASGYRRQGLGTQAIQLLQEQYPGRTFVTFPDDGEGFWTGLGWQRYNHNQGGDHPPLFVSR